MILLNGSTQTISGNRLSANRAVVAAPQAEVIRRKHTTTCTAANQGAAEEIQMPATKSTCFFLLI